MSKKAHILCVAAGAGAGRYTPPVGFNTFVGGLQEVVAGDLWIGPRPYLETLKPLPAVKDPMAFIETLVAGMTGDGAKDVQGMLAGAASLSDLISGKNEPSVQYPAYIQIIPYYLFRNKGRYLRYIRTVTGGDARLHGKVSVGIGGHVDLKDVVVDADGRIDLVATLALAGKREAHEEIGANIADEAFRFIGTIYATDTEVDRVHLGVVGVCDLTDDQAAALVINHEIGDHAFMTLAEVRDEANADPNKTLETWTRLVIESNPLA